MTVHIYTHTYIYIYTYIYIKFLLQCIWYLTPFKTFLNNTDAECTVFNVACNQYTASAVYYDERWGRALSPVWPKRPQTCRIKSEWGEGKERCLPQTLLSQLLLCLWARPPNPQLSQWPDPTGCAGQLPGVSVCNCVCEQGAPGEHCSQWSHRE